MERIVSPRQRRSYATLERVLSAAEEHIGLAGLAGLDLRRVCERAGVTTGAFYARFRKKEDLLLELLERFGQQMAGVLVSFSASENRRTARDVVVEFIHTLATVYQTRGALIAALIEGSYSQPALRQRAVAMMGASVSALQAALTAVGRAELHPDSVRFAAYLMFSWFDQRLYFGSLAAGGPADNERLAEVALAALQRPSA